LSSILLGVDPGIARLGYGVIEVQGNHLHAIAYGCIETPAHTPVAERLQTIYHRLTDVIRQHQPNVMIVEELFFSRNVTTAFVVGQARGVALLAAAEGGLTTAEYTPMQVKQAVVGYGKAEKKQVQEMVKILLRLTQIPKPDDTADALAIAITHAHTSPMEQAIAGSKRVESPRAIRRPL